LVGQSPQGEITLEVRLRSSDLREFVRDMGFGPFRDEGGREILRRVFVSVRDRAWREIAPTYWQWGIRETENRIQVSARHTSALVDFQWQGALQVSPDRRALSFEFEGEALKTMEVCRLGLVVLHPVSGMVGGRLTTRDLQALTIATHVLPQRIMDGMPCALTEPFSSLTIETPQWGRLELDLAGDRFELEDQRNWGDDSFKTYCTPLRFGFPRTVQAGTRIRHRVQGRWTPETSAPGRKERKAASTGQFPVVARERELAVEGVSADKHSLEWVQSRVEKVSRVLVYGEGSAPPTAEAVKSWRAVVAKASGRSIPVLAATRGYFVEFNRDAGRWDSADGIAFPLSATVHGVDALTIAENVGTIVDLARTAREVLGVSKIVISPLALHYPSQESATFPQGMVGAWLTAMLIHCSLAQVSSVRLAADVVDALPVRLLQHLEACQEAESLSAEVDVPRGLDLAVVRRKGAKLPQLLIANLTAETLSLSMIGSSIRALKAVDGLTDQAVSVCPERIDVPAFGVVFVEIERVGHWLV
jgi:hypothetical protein